MSGTQVMLSKVWGRYLCFYKADFSQIEPGVTLTVEFYRDIQDGNGPVATGYKRSLYGPADSPGAPGQTVLLHGILDLDKGHEVCVFFIPSAATTVHYNNGVFGAMQVGGAQSPSGL